MQNPNIEPDFKILVATDCHLGYADQDGERGDDSLNTFEEILKIARSNEVDFILLGGDLFHDNKPSRKTLHRCMQLIRRYCMGDRPIEMEILSDQSENFKHNAFPNVNYEDPNLNISIPVFTIHGNHDDPCGSGGFSPVNLLSVSGLLNYFGQQKELEDLQITPLLFEKGSTKLAIYGLGSLREERLHHLFLAKKVSLICPSEDFDAWFSIFIIHQNRVKHGPTNNIPEEFIDSNMDLVVWGHEHECKIEPEYNRRQDFFVTQPGSSIATSLCPGEAVKKHVGLLKIRGKKFKLEPIPLKTVRPFYMESIDLSETDLDMTDIRLSEKVFKYCCKKIDRLLEQACLEHTGDPRQPKKPLIRLRVAYTEHYSVFNSHRLGQLYIDKVANPKDMILFQRKKVTKNKLGKDDQGEMNILFRALDVSSVEGQIQEYFDNVQEHENLKMLSVKTLGQGLRIFVEKMENAAISKLIEDHMKEVQKHLREVEADDETMLMHVLEYRKSHFDTREIDSATFMKDASSSIVVQFNSDEENDGSDVDIGVTKKITPTSNRGRGRARGRQSSGTSRATGSGRGRGRRRGAKSSNSTTRGHGRNTHTAAISSEDDSLSENENFSTHPSQNNQKNVCATRKKGVVFSDDDDF